MEIISVTKAWKMAMSLKAVIHITELRTYLPITKNKAKRNLSIFVVIL